MSKDDSGPTGSLLDRVRTEAKGPQRRWPKVVLALLILAVVGGGAGFFLLQGSGLLQKLGVTSQTSLEVMRVHEKLGDKAYAKGRYADAVISYRQAIEAKGDISVPYRKLARAYLAMTPPKLKEGEEALLRALEIDPRDLAASVALAQFHLNQGMYLQALKRCERALSDANIGDGARKGLLIAQRNLLLTAARAADQLGEVNKAIKYGNSYVAKAPLDAGAALFLAGLYQKRYLNYQDGADLRSADEMLAQAENRARGLHEMQSAEPAHLYTIAKVLIARGQHLSLGRDEADPEKRDPEADAFYRGALRAVQKAKGWKREGGNPTEEVQLRAQIFILLDQFEDAVDLLRKEQMAKPRVEIMASLLSVMLQSDDREVLEEALRKAESAVQMYKHPRIRILRANIQDRLGREDEADRDLAKAVEDAAAAGSEDDQSLWLRIVADRLKAKGDILKSEEKYRAALQQNPNNLPARLQLLDIIGMRYLRAQGDEKAARAARKELDQALDTTRALSAGALGVRLWTAVVKFGDGRLGEARDLLRQVVQVRANLPLAHLILGRCRQSLGDLEGAIASFHKVIAIEKRAAKAAGSDRPPLEASCSDLLVAYVGANRLEDAISWGRDALEYHPKSRKLMYFLGIALMREKNYAAARELFEDLTDAHPAWGPGHGMLGQAKYLQGLRLDAYDSFREGIRIDDRIEVRLIVARFFLGQNDMIRATDEYEAIVERFSNDPYAYRLLGRFHHVTGNRDKAREILRKGIEVDPEYLPNYEELADTYVSEGVPTAEGLKEARRLASEALRRNPERIPALLLLGRTLLRQSEVAEAIRIFEDLLSRSPDLLPAKILLAEALIKSANPDLARCRKQLEAVLARMPSHPGATALMGRISFLEAAHELVRGGGDVELANQRLAESLTYDPTNVQARLLRADTLHRLSIDDPRRLEQALQEAHELIKSEPKNPLGFVLLGEILSKKANRSLGAAISHDALDEAEEAERERASAAADFKAAEEHLAKSIELDPTFFGGPLAMGEHLMRRGKPAEAHDMFRRALANEPLDLRAFRGAMASLMARKKEAQAEALCRERLALGDDTGVVAVMLGVLLETRKPPTEALKIYRNTLAKNNRNGLVASRLIATLLREGRGDEALSIALQLRRDVPRSARYAFEVGRVHLAGGRYGEARAALADAIELSPKMSAAYAFLHQAYAGDEMFIEAIETFQNYLKSGESDQPVIRSILGQLHEKRGNFLLAKENYKQALALRPKNPLASNNLAWILSWHQGNAEQALPHALAARAARPRDPNIADTLAWIYVLKGDWEKALVLLESIEPSMKGNAGYQLHRARALEGLGRNDEARKWLDRAEKALAGQKQVDERLRKEIRETRDRIF